MFPSLTHNINYCGGNSVSKFPIGEEVTGQNREKS